MARNEDEWLHGWDDTPGIVSVWGEPDGRAWIWRRQPGGAVSREEQTFRPWLLSSSLLDFQSLGARLIPHHEHAPWSAVTYAELSGDVGLRYLVRGPDLRLLRQTLLRGASERLGRPLNALRELGNDAVLALPPEEQYLVATGRCYFRGLGYDDVTRLQLDLETTGLDPDIDRIFLIAIRGPGGEHELLEAPSDTDDAERALLLALERCVAKYDPDVIENHNLHGFDWPFLMRRAERLKVRLHLGRRRDVDFGLRAASRGARLGQAGARWLERLRRARYTLPGRELIDSMDAVRRHDFSARDLPGHGLKVVARHLGLASPERQYLPGSRVHEVWLKEPDLVRRYATDDVDEAAGVARLLGGAAFSLAQMAPRRYERLADAGAATGVLDPLLVRAYLRAGRALPPHAPGDGTPHQGAALHLFASGVAKRVVKADVASLYPSLMRQYRIGPRRDELGVFLAIVDQLVERRLRAKAGAKAEAPGFGARFQLEALSAAYKLVINSAYGYLGAVSLTRFADVHAANEVTARGRELLSLMCRELAQRGVQLLEADTDGVYFSMPEGATPEDEQRVVAEVAALLPPLVDLQFDGRYRAMLSHEPKNYALESYSGQLTLRGVAFRSSRAEPFGEAFLRRAVSRLLAGDVAGVRRTYVESVRQIREKRLETRQVCARVRLTKTPAEYAQSRRDRQELPYEALLQNGREHWAAGERVYVYRRTLGRAGLWQEALEDEVDGGEPGAEARDSRDYDAEHYVRLLTNTFASRLARGLSADDFAAVIADPDRPSLFERSLHGAGPILSVLSDPITPPSGRSATESDVFE
ncbi:MAG: DNA polymerase II [Myxococcales bacterium]|nr:MAG: DNA polymerase II [Myxococcales bacterium]